MLRVQVAKQSVGRGLMVTKAVVVKIPIQLSAAAAKTRELAWKVLSSWTDSLTYRLVCSLISIDVIVL